MSAKHGPPIGQGELWTPAEVQMPQLSDLDIDPDQVITISRLLRAVSEYTALPAAYIGQDAYQLATTEVVHEGLYIDRNDSRFRGAENLFHGVVHPSGEFKMLSHSPRAIASHAMNNTRDSFKLEEIIVEGKKGRQLVGKDGNEIDRDEIEGRVKRSAGHQLEKYGVKLEGRRNELSEERLALLGLVKELRAPGRAHYKAKNLNIMRERGEKAIRQAVEVAAINMDWGSVTVDGLHKAVMYKIYGLPGHNNARLRNFYEWTMLTGKWTRARMYGFDVAIRNLWKEFAHYERYLEKSDAEKPA